MTKTLKLFFLTIAILALVYVIYSSLKPLPAVEAKADLPASVKTTSVNLPWPAYGQGALGADGYGILADHGAQTPVPIASITKVITALAVLKQKPLQPGQQGPSITISQTDFDSYNFYYLNDGSVSRVAVGEQISEYQALQAMLLPSSNNMADTLAAWAFGSMQNYLNYANKMVKDMGLSNTTVRSANGFYDETTSTAEDLVRLGLAAIDEPVVAQIVKQPTAVIPVAGTIRNYNWLLNEDGVIGIKTGNTDKAGGCFLFASQRSIGGQNITVIGALLSAPDLNASIADARTVLKSVDSGFEVMTPVKAGQVVGTYTSSWGEKVNAVAKKSISLPVWRGQDISVWANLKPLKTGDPAGKIIGSVSVKAGEKSASSSVELESSVPSPPLWWRLTNF